MILPLGWGRSIFLGESQSRIYPNMCAKFGCGPTVVSKRGGVQTDRQRDTVALYSRLCCGYHHLRPTRQRTRNKTPEECNKRCGILQVGLAGSGEKENKTSPRNTDSNRAKGHVTLPYIAGVTEPISHLIRKTGDAIFFLTFRRRLPVRGSGSCRDLSIFLGRWPIPP